MERMFNIRESEDLEIGIIVDTETKKVYIREDDWDIYAGGTAFYNPGELDYLDMFKHVAKKLLDSELEELSSLLKEESIERKIVELIQHFNKELKNLK